MLNMKRPCVIKEIPEGFLPRGNEEYYPEGIDDFTLVSVIITDPYGKMFCYPNEVAVNFGWGRTGGDYKHSISHYRIEKYNAVKFIEES